MANSASFQSSWVGTLGKLIRRPRSGVATYGYLGTSAALTQYSGRAESHINGATTPAGTLGILGRGFGDNTVPVAGTYNPVLLSCFASVRGSNGALTDMSISKDSHATSAALTLATCASGSSAQLWRSATIN